MSHLFLSHLSKNNNTPELVQALFHPHAGNTEIIVASRYNETAVYQVNHTDNPLLKITRTVSKKPQLQLSLF